MSLEEGLYHKEKCGHQSVPIDPKTQRKTENDRVGDKRGGSTRKK